MTIYANRYVSDLDVAQDITQEVFIKLYEKRENLVIHTSVRNHCVDHVRSCKVQQLYNDSVQKEYSILPEVDSSYIKETELQEKIYKAIHALPKQNKKIFTLSLFEGKTNQEIADMLNISKRTVETHISNAIKRIKSLIFFVFTILIIS